MGYVTVATIPGIAEVPWGHEHDYSIYINGKNYYLPIRLRVVEMLNGNTYFETDLVDVTYGEANVQKGKPVLLFAENTFWIKGIITDVTYTTDGFAKIICMGTEWYLKNNPITTLSSAAGESGRQQYTSTATSTIISELVSKAGDGASPWIATIGTNTNYGDITVRFENTNRLNAIMGIANATNYDWWMSNVSTDDYVTNYVNFDSRRGSASSVFTFNVGGTSQNAIVTSREEDLESCANYVTCYDEETEVLTKNGFKLFRDVSFDDEIATLNPDTNCLEWQRPIALQDYYYDGEMYSIESKQINLKITPDHSVYYRPHWKKDYILESIETANERCTIRFKKDASWEGTDLEYFELPIIPNYHNSMTIVEKIPIDLWLRFMGWYLSEGCLHKNIKKGYKISIRQCNEETLTEIYDLVKNMGFKPFLIKDGSIQFYSKQLYEYLKQFGKAKDKYVPNYIKDLPPERLKLFMETIFRGDGCVDSDGTLRGYYTISKRLADDVFEIALKGGYATNLSRNKNCWYVAVNKTTIEPFAKKSHNNSNISIENYEGRIYDLTVPKHHVIYVRREGKGIWSGNCLGYGDGVNQLKTSFYDSSAISTTLATALTASATTVVLTDASSFASSGEIIVAEERITYTGKTGNNLTGCTRGASSTTAITHPAKVYVAKYVAPTEAASESGSSINTNGLKTLEISDVGLVDNNTAQLICSRYLLERKDVPVRITLQPMDGLSVIQNVNIGDDVTITDSDTGLNTDYRVVRRETIVDEGGMETQVLEISNKKLAFLEAMDELRKQQKDESLVMKGDMVSYVSPEKDNCDSSTGLTMSFYVPKEAVNINTIKLNYKIKKYRVDSTVSLAGTAHAHSVTIPLGGNHAHYISGNTGFEDSINHRHYVNAAPGWSNYTEPSHKHSIGFVSDAAMHTHGGVTSASEQGHFHDLRYGITEDTGGWSVSDMTIEIDGVDKTAVFEALNGTLVVAQNGTDSNNTIQSSWLSGLAADTWHTITLKPNANCRIEAQLYVQLFLKGEVVA